MIIVPIPKHKRGRVAWLQSIYVSFGSEALTLHKLDTSGLKQLSRFCCMDYKNEGIKYTVMEFIENYSCNGRNCSSNLPLRKPFKILSYQPNGWRSYGRLFIHSFIHFLYVNQIHTRLSTYCLWNLSSNNTEIQYKIYMPCQSKCHCDNHANTVWEYKYGTLHYNKITKQHIYKVQTYHGRRNMLIKLKFIVEKSQALQLLKRSSRV